MPERSNDGTFVYSSMRQAINYANMAGFDVVSDNLGKRFASRDDMVGYFELVEVPSEQYLNYIWKRVHVRSYA